MSLLKDPSKIMQTEKDIEKIKKEFLNEGLIIRKIQDQKSLKWIKSTFEKLVKKELKKIKKKIPKDFDYFNHIHKLVSRSELNEFRLNIFKGINNIKQFKYHYYKIAQPYLNTLAGDELVIQKKINLSIQCPNDNTSLLPIHADTWDGDSPYELVVWLPLVDCFKTKSMFMLPRKFNRKFEEIYKKNKSNKFNIFNALKKKLKWLNINFGEVLIFNLCLPHGNTINKELETRWSMNCRFKNLFSPYADKKLGEFFTPLDLKPLTEIGMQYKFPDEE